MLRVKDQTQCRRWRGDKAQILGGDAKKKKKKVLPLINRASCNCCDLLTHRHDRFVPCQTNGLTLTLSI